jgi:hypothetical protein
MRGLGGGVPLPWSDSLRDRGTSASMYVDLVMPNILMAEFVNDDTRDFSAKRLRGVT